MDRLPLVDVSPLLDPQADTASCARVGAQLDVACRDGRWSAVASGA